MLPMMLIPYIYLFAFQFYGYATCRLDSLGAIGVVGMLLHKIIPSMVLFYKHKYEMAEVSDNINYN